VKPGRTGRLRTLLQTEMTESNPVRRSGDSSMIRLIRTYGLILLHSGLVIGLSLLVSWLDGAKVNPAEGERYTNGKTYLRASDITTFISGALVAVRLVTNCLAGIFAWKCAFLLLEKSSLDLRQFNMIMSYHVPWSMGLQSGKLCQLVKIILLLMLPSTFVAPLLSGAIDWRSVSVLVDAGLVDITLQAPDPDNWSWYQFNVDVREKLADRATGISALAWSSIEHNDANGCRHVVPINPNLPVNSVVENATVPCINVHNITWYESSPPQYVLDVLDDPRNISLTGDEFETFYRGNAILFDRTRWIGVNHRPFPPPSRFTGEKTIAVVVGGNWTACSKTSKIELMFGLPADAVVGVELPINVAGPTCAMVGTVKFTAGVVKNVKSTYISRRVIEVRDIPDQLILADRWVTEVLYLMPDVMTRVSLMNATSLVTWKNLDSYVESLIRYSYMATWDAMDYIFDETTRPPLKAQRPVPMLEASISTVRVLSWLGMQLLLGLAGLLVLYMQQSCSR